MKRADLVRIKEDEICLPPRPRARRRRYSHR